MGADGKDHFDFHNFDRTRIGPASECLFPPAQFRTRLDVPCRPAHLAGRTGPTVRRWMSLRGRAVEERTIFQPSAAGSVKPGTRLNGVYEIEALIAQGGMGEVYRGFQHSDPRPRGDQDDPPEFSNNPEVLELFRREASILHNLMHEAIVRYFVFSVDPDDPARVSRDGIRRRAVADERLGFGAAAARRGQDPAEADRAALEAAHRLGVIHRDISSDNIILPDGDVRKAKIIDFGIARSLSVGERTIIGGGFAGKYNYVSPEQLGLAGGDVTFKSDIYSFGLVLAEAARGRALDMNGSQAEIIEKRRAVPIFPMSTGRCGRCSRRCFSRRRKTGLPAWRRWPNGARRSRGERPDARTMQRRRRARRGRAGLCPRSSPRSSRSSASAAPATSFATTRPLLRPFPPDPRADPSMPLDLGRRPPTPTTSVSRGARRTRGSPPLGPTTRFAAADVGTRAPGGRGRRDTPPSRRRPPRAARPPRASPRVPHPLRQAEGSQGNRGVLSMTCAAARAAAALSTSPGHGRPPDRNSCRDLSTPAGKELRLAASFCPTASRSSDPATAKASSKGRHAEPPAPLECASSPQSRRQDRANDNHLSSRDRAPRLPIPKPVPPAQPITRPPRRFPFPRKKKPFIEDAPGDAATGSKRRARRAGAAVRPRATTAAIASSSSLFPAAGRPPTPASATSRAVRAVRGGVQAAGPRRPQLSLRPITTPECPILNLLRPGVGDASWLPRISLRTTRSAATSRWPEGSPISAEDSTFSSWSTTTASPIASRRSPEPGDDAATFGVPLTPDAGSARQLQVLLAIVSTKPIRRSRRSLGPQKRSSRASRGGAKR